MMRSILNAMRSLTKSQCSSLRLTALILSLAFTCATSLAALLCTRWIFEMRFFGSPYRRLLLASRREVTNACTKCSAVGLSMNLWTMLAQLRIGSLEISLKNGQNHQFWVWSLQNILKQMSAHLKSDLSKCPRRFYHMCSVSSQM